MKKHGDFVPLSAVSSFHNQYREQPTQADEQTEAHGRVAE